jgi:hypothetical protein
LICNSRSGSMRFPTPGLDRRFRSPNSGSFRKPPSPRSLAQTRFILSYASLLFTVLPSPVCPGSKDLRRLPWDLAVPLRDICHPRLTPRAILACSVPFRPQRFSRPRRFPPRLALWVYFTPLPRPGFSLQGFDSSTAANDAFTPSLPSRRSFQLC